MINPKCKGCTRFFPDEPDQRCTIKKKGTDIETNCPCQICLVKVSCRESCFDFRRHLVDSYGVNDISDEMLKEYHGPPNKVRHGL